MTHPQVLSSLANVGLSTEEEERAWELYELMGSMEEVARSMGVRVHIIKQTLCRDQIRLVDVQTTRMEQMARRWEENESKAAGATSMMLDVLVGMIKHIEACSKAGTDTDLVDTSNKVEKKLSVTHAYQWLLLTGQLDKISKVGFNAAKISETMRLLAFDKEHAKGSNRAHDPSTMSDEDLWNLISEMEAAGRALPWGVAQWRDAQLAKRGRAPGM